MNRPHCHPESRTGRGFTLTELLVATTILTLLMVLFFGIVSSTSRLYSRGRAKMDNFATGRALIGTLARDVSDMVVVSELASFPSDGEKNLFAFYIRQPGVDSSSSTLRNLSLIEYAFDKDTAKLTRRDLAIGWSDLNKISFGTDDALPKLAQATARDVCSGVLGFSYDFIMRDGSIAKSFSERKKVVAVRYSLAVISEKGELILTNQGKLKPLVESFKSTATAAGINGAKEEWTKLLTSLVPSYPPEVIGEVEVFEQCVPLPGQTVL